jgi:hypothetical protein
MNLDLDLSVFSRFFRGMVTELRQKPLLAGAGVVLVLALVAVPFLLSKSSSPAPAPEAQLPASPPQGGASIPALNVQTTPSKSHLSGAARNPFGSSGSAAATAHTLSPSTVVAVSTPTSNTASTLSNGGASSTGGSSSTGSSSSTGTASGGTPSSTPNPPSITGNAKPKPAPSGLTKDEAYDVSLAITNSAGGLNTLDPLERLSVLPGDQQPLLVELGVAQGGNRVLFAVQPGAVVSGPGSCTPGPIDCAILSLGQDQTEQLSSQTGTLGSSPVALFAVTSISATKYSSAAAADKARRAASSAGQKLLDGSSSQALSLFQYEPSLGSVVDLRTLGVN